mmetsp:Transcript_32842/g.69086  ORF Transcript_32842/g.69086 Transcript_32842/m.69086 type:complete len:309 (+) Transcript_32842:47-973(+)|eukprot:CAMPEP_0172315230 /NCGR_PEP_ID=MMETSP1058-20130122/24523_1 /TAXON_ID=83371 /ORGANISM="Detonula confervacea, Strain CCMP 353" /LENGTH=308 /DNA_ID=CAMNT_0013029273 /DNA_START=44 /DNA_END=970 /DNA_ORIENTATION=-
MPLSSRNISRKLGKSGKGTASSIIENLKLQHAEELDTTNDEHEKKVELLEKEIDQCRAEIDALKLSSDEHYDTLMPLPSPSKSLKFVRNTSSRKQRNKAAAGGIGGNNNAVSIIADMKLQHRKDLARAGAIYAKKLHSMKKEVAKYEAEALKACAIRDGEKGFGFGGTSGVNRRTGVAEKDKENVSQKQALSRSDQSSKLKNDGREVAQKEKTTLSQKLTAARRDEAKSQHQNGHTKKARGGMNESDNLKDQYERLFLDEYQFPAYEEAIALGNGAKNQGLDNEEIDEICKDLIAFMTDVKIKPKRLL